MVKAMLEVLFQTFSPIMNDLKIFPCDINWREKNFEKRFILYFILSYEIVPLCMAYCSINFVML